MKLLYAEDHGIIRDAVTTALEKDYGWIVKQVSNGLELVNEFNSTYEGVLTNINMPVMTGIEAVKIIRPKTNIKIIAFTGYEDKGKIKEFRDAGGDGAVLKTREQSIEAIHRVFTTDTVLKSEADILLSKEPEEQGLTNTEKKILNLLNQGLRLRGIAERLFISPLTAKKHKQNILNKGYKPTTIYQRSI
jgi:DNA-binding NarL/FixJ family response regulator